MGTKREQPGIWQMFMQTQERRRVVFFSKQRPSPKTRVNNHFNNPPAESADVGGLAELCVDAGGPPGAKARSKGGSIPGESQLETKQREQLRLKLKACSEGWPATKLGRLLDSQRGNNCRLHEDEHSVQLVFFV